MKALFLYLKLHQYWIALFAISIIQISIILIYQFNGYFGQDSYEYLKTTRELIQYYKGGPLPTYSVFPGMYPFICSLIGLLIPDTLFVLQFVSLIALMVSYILLRKIILMIYKTDKYLDIYLFLFFALSPYILRFSIISMSDITGIVLWLTALYFSLQFQLKGRINSLLFACLFSGFAIMTRYPAVVILIMPAVICIRQILKQKKYHLFVIGVVFFLLGSLPDYFLKGRFFFWDITGNESTFSYFYFLDQYSISNFFRRDFYNLDGWQHYKYPNIVYVFQIFVHPAFIFTGLLFILFARKKQFAQKEQQLTLLTIILYLCFLAGNAYQSDRYLMFVLPLLLVFYYASFLEILNKFEFTNKKLFLFIFMITAIQLALFIYSFRVTLEMNKNEKNIADTISSLPKGVMVYTFSIDGAIKAYYPEVKIFDIYTNSLTDSTIQNGYLLFNYEAFSNQFTDLNPMENYQFLHSHYTLQSEKKFENGWELFQIK